MSNINQHSLETFFDNLTALRTARNLSVEQLATAAQVPQKVLLQAEDGVLSKSFSTTHLFRLCEFFQVQPADLFLDVK